MMNKRITATLTAFFASAAIIFGAQSCSAAKADVSVSKDGEVEITFSEPAGKFGRTVYVFSPDAELSDALTADDLSKAIRLDLSKGSVYTFKFADNAPRGMYTAVTDDGGIGEIIIIPFIDETEEANALAEIKSAAPAQLQEVLEKYNGRVYSIQFPESQSERDGVVRIMHGVLAQKNPQSSQQITECYDVSRQIYALSISDTDNTRRIIDESGADIGLKIVENSDYKKYPDDVAKMFVSIRNAESIIDISSADTSLRTAAALVGFNNALRGDRAAKIREYNDIFKLDLSGDFSTVNEVRLNKELDGKNASTVSQLKEIVISAVNAAKDDDDDKNNSSASRGNGSGGGGNRSNISVGTTGSAVIDSDKLGELSGKEGIKFSDTSAYGWANDEIEYLAYHGIMTGDGSGMFRPADNITREEFVKILVSAFNLEDNSLEENKFADVDVNAWYAPSIHNAYGKGIIQGISNSVFGVGQSITRQDAAVIICRLTESEGYTIQSVREGVLFDDSERISEYALFSVDTLYKAGIVNGADSNMFNPTGFLSRAEAAKLLYSTLDNLRLTE